jgi:subfamily B ATP-binding cassette protein MsbA
MKSLWRAIKLAKTKAWLAPIYLITVFFHTVFRIINFAALVPVLKILFDQSDHIQPATKDSNPGFSDSGFIDTFYEYLQSIIINEGKLTALYWVSGLLVGSVFLTNLFLYVANVIQEHVRITIISDLRKRVFDSLIGLDQHFFIRQKKGDLLSRITSDVQSIEMTITSTLRVIIKEPVLIVSYFITLYYISPQLTLYTLLLIPISGSLIGYLARKLRRQSRRAQHAIGGITSLMDELISSIKIIQLFSGETFVRKKFTDEVDFYADQNRQMAFAGNLAGPVSEFLGVSFVAVILVLGGGMILSNESTLDAANFLLFLIVFSQVLTPAKAISNAFSKVQRGIASAERTFELIDVQPVVVEKPDAQRVSDLKEEIRFDHVSFAYEDQRVINDISFVLPKGKVIALVGPSGGGKTTIASLLPRYYDPGAGQILFDGIDLKDYHLKDVRHLMGLVTQESILINDTIEENIRFGNVSASTDEIIEAAKSAYAHDFIMKLPDGYDTLIGDMGMKLSGGERQRITVARALLKNPPILILDEATSSLDTESEKQVQEAIINLMQNRTTLVIAHRLSTIIHADEILVIEDGEIVESGTHAELASNDGRYQKMIEMQQF